MKTFQVTVKDTVDHPKVVAAAKCSGSKCGSSNGGCNCGNGKCGGGGP